MSNKTLSKPRWDNLLAELTAQDVEVEVKEVCAYLDEFPDIADVVIAICQRTREEFGPDAELNLFINRDPEIDDKYLKLRVSLPVYGSDMWSRLDAIADAHEDQLWDKSGWIRLTTDFRPIG
jgi:hypothetical protein